MGGKNYFCFTDFIKLKLRGTPLQRLAATRWRIRDKRMGTIKDRSRMDLKEAENIKKRWQEYTELCKKLLHDPDSHDGVITHLEPEILE